MTTADLTDAFVLPAVAVIAVIAVRAWLERIAHLRLSLFRPYRGDPWPQGVQEEYDVRFDWTPRAATESPGGSVALESVDSIRLRRTGH
jgi:hypothetical protein